MIPTQTFSIATSEITSLLNGDYYPLAGHFVPSLVQRLPVSNKDSPVNVAIRHLKNFYKIKSYCVAPGEWSRRPLQAHATWIYVAEAIAYAETGDDSHVEAIWRNGLRTPHSRFIQEDVKVGTPNWTKEDAKQYLDRLVALARIVASRGQVPSADDLHRRSGRRDDHLGGAIDETGGVLHFRKGHHRMILAKQLEVPAVPVAIHVVHSSWLQRLLNVNDEEFRAAISERSTEHHHVRDTIQRYLVARLAPSPTDSKEPLKSRPDLAVATS